MAYVDLEISGLREQIIANAKLVFNDDTQSPQSEVFDIVVRAVNLNPGDRKKFRGYKATLISTKTGERPIVRTHGEVKQQGPYPYVPIDEHKLFIDALFSLLYETTQVLEKSQKI